MERVKRPDEPDRRHPGWMRLGAVAGSFALACAGVVAAELTLRAAGFTWFPSAETLAAPDPERGTPGQVYEYKGKGPFRSGAAGTSNHLGHRAPEPAAFGCPTPVVALGDSYTRGSLLPDGQSWPDQFQQRLTGPDVCTYNAGVGGAGFTEQRQHLAAVLSAGIRPSTVIHLFFFDDFLQVAGPISESIFWQDSPFFFLLQGLTLASLRLHYHLAWKHERVRKHIPPADFRGILPVEDHRKLEIAYTSQWEEFADWLDTEGISLLTGFIPNFASMLRGQAPELETLQDAHRKRGIPHYVFTRMDFPEDPMLFNDFHFNAGAYSRIAERFESMFTETLSANLASDSPLTP